jgi:hypothetical protein
MRFSVQDFRRVDPKRPAERALPRTDKGWQAWTPRTLRDLIDEYLERRHGQVAPKTLKIERDLLAGVLAPQLGDRLLADLEPVDFGKAVADYAARLRGRGDRMERTRTSCSPPRGACSNSPEAGG